MNVDAGNVADPGADDNQVNVTNMDFYGGQRMLIKWTLMGHQNREAFVCSPQVSKNL